MSFIIIEKSTMDTRTATIRKQISRPKLRITGILKSISKTLQTQQKRLKNGVRVTLRNKYSELEL